MTFSIPSLLSAIFLIASTGDAYRIRTRSCTPVTSLIDEMITSPFNSVCGIRRMGDSYRVMDPFFRKDVLLPSISSISSPGQVLSQMLTTDLSETTTDYFISMDVPGVEDVDIIVKDRTITISAERKRVTPSPEQPADRVTNSDTTDSSSSAAYSSERSYGKVTRSFTVPKSADLDKAEADLKNGVLTVRIPKIPLEEAPGPRKLVVNKAAGTPAEIKKLDNPVAETVAEERIEL